jgi:dolichol-phosphate mannosyltransferase
MEKIGMLPERNRRFHPVDQIKENSGSGSAAEVDVKSPFLSVIVPLFNEELVIGKMYETLSSVLQNRMDYEVIMVNDGSKDGTLKLAKEICNRDPRIKLISFSRNFGHQSAITSGLDRARGEIIVVIDADLQDPPGVILDMIEKWKQGYHVVFGVRKNRKGESLFKLITASIFYKILRKMTSVDIPVDAGDFRLMDRRVVDQLKQMREKSRFVRGMVSWVGFKQTEIEYVRETRFAGETKYPFNKMLKFAIDGILSFSQIPLKFSGIFGFLCSIVSFLMVIYGLVSKFIYPESTVPGWTSIFIAILFIGGVQLITIGVLGEYIGRIYEETKGRPIYIVDEEINFK